jgi:hypothetical protein
LGLEDTEVRRRLFLDWFTKGIVGAVVAPKTIFDLGSVHPVNASDVSWPPVTGGPVTFILIEGDEDDEGWGEDE